MHCIDSQARCIADSLPITPADSLHRMCFALLTSALPIPCRFLHQVVTTGKSICVGVVKQDKDKGIFPLKIREPMILEAAAFHVVVGQSEGELPIHFSTASSERRVS